MSSIARYISYAFSHLSTPDHVDDPVTSRTLQSLFSASVVPLARGFLWSSPYVKTPFSDVSLTSDTSTSSSCSDVSVSPRPSLESDIFSPPRHIRSSSLPLTPSPPSHLVGLGISGVPRKDGKQGDFDGLGFVGVRRSFNPKSPFLGCGDEDEDDDGYISPTPLHVSQTDQDRGRDEEELSETFIRELIFTWEADPQHTRVLCTIPECDDENEAELQQAVNIVTAPKPGTSLAVPSSELSSSSRAPHCAPLPMSPSSPSPAAHTASQSRASSSLSRTIYRAHSKRRISCPLSRPSHRTDDRSQFSSPSEENPLRGRTLARAKKPSGPCSTRDEEGVGHTLNKKKPAAKAVWRV